MRSRLLLSCLPVAVVTLFLCPVAGADPCCLNLACEDRDPADCAAQGGTAGYCRIGEACGAPACDGAQIGEIGDVTVAVRIRPGGRDLHLGWPADPNADSYHVRFVSAPDQIPDLRAGNAPPAADVPGCVPTMIPEANHIDPVSGAPGEVFFYGVIGSCTEDATGACCDPRGGNCDILTRRECDERGWRFAVGVMNCDCLGACCYADGSPCREVSRNICVNVPGGAFSGSLTSCAETDCAFGACCMPWGCMETTAAACTLESGSYMGDGIGCSTHPCGPTGACCHTSGCLDWLFQVGCADGMWGTWIGFDTLCAGTDCTEHQGACCDWPFPGECVDGTWEGQCIGSGGSWAGGGTDCGSSPC